MEYLAFVGTGDGTFENLFLGSFFLMLYIIFIVPAALTVLIFAFRHSIRRNPVKFVGLLAGVVLFGLGWVLAGPSDDALAIFLNFVFAPLVITGSLYWFSQLDKNDRQFMLKSSLLVGNAVLLLLTVASNLFA